MHAAGSGRSCVGCHNREALRSPCAGCHSAGSLAVLSRNSCAACHSTPAGYSDEEAENGSLLKLDKGAAAQLAGTVVAERGEKRAMAFDQNDIPEKVRMDGLSGEYAAAELEHRKIVNSMAEKQQGSRLARVFHSEKNTLCQGCHHNSPSSRTPPKCASCHGVGAQPVTGPPPLKAAYHQQCMTCHARIQQKPAATECADCHKPLGNQSRLP